MYDEKKIDTIRESLVEQDREIPRLVSQQVSLVEQLSEIVDIINMKLDQSVLRDQPVSPAGTQDAPMNSPTTTHLGHRLGTNNESLQAQIDKLRLINNRLEV